MVRPQFPPYQLTNMPLLDIKRLYFSNDFFKTASLKDRVNDDSGVPFSLYWCNVLSYFQFNVTDGRCMVPTIQAH